MAPREQAGAKRAGREPERPWAVEVMRQLDVIRGAFRVQTIRRLLGRPAWPRLPGSYALGDSTGSVAVCALTSGELSAPLAGLPGVVIAGRVYTANLGLEKIIVNVTTNPRIRFLVLCGRDSPLFHPGQTLQALFANGVDLERRVVGAEGYLPVLRGISTGQIERFRRQVELVDRVGQLDLAAIATLTAELAARSPGPYLDGQPPTSPGSISDSTFQTIRPGGKRQPLAYDPRGYFVITLDEATQEIVLRHYLPDNTPVHEMRGRSGEGMLLGLLREELISQLSHAGYLGAELTKAETALRLGLVYEQDRPLRPATSAIRASDPTNQR